jgi:hypothetical protein
MAAVAALECPAVRRPVPQARPRRIRVLAARPPSATSTTCAATRTGAPCSATSPACPAGSRPPTRTAQTVIASAFPDRSIEGAWDWRCQMGHTHPFVITAVALLGAELPGVGTLASLQDVGRLYGVDGTPELVAASAAQDAAAPRQSPSRSRPAGRTPHAEPHGPHVAATVTSDDVRRAFYESPIGSDWDAWIEEIQLDPLQIIYIDDDEGARYRVPVTIDGRRSRRRHLRRARPGRHPLRGLHRRSIRRRQADPIRVQVRVPPRPAAPRGPTDPGRAAGDPTHRPKEADAMSDTLNQGLRERLGISRRDRAGRCRPAGRRRPGARRARRPRPRHDRPRPCPRARSSSPRPARGAADRGAGWRRRPNRQLTEDRDREIAAAIGDGRIAPEPAGALGAGLRHRPRRRLHRLASLPKGLIPVTATGRGVDPDASTDPAAGDNYWFAGRSPPARPRGGLTHGQRVHPVLRARRPRSPAARPPPSPAAGSSASPAPASPPPARRSASSRSPGHRRRPRRSASPPVTPPSASR